MRWAQFGLAHVSGPPTGAVPWRAGGGGEDSLIGELRQKSGAGERPSQGNHGSQRAGGTEGGRGVQ